MNIMKIACLHKTQPVSSNDSKKRFAFTPRLSDSFLSNSIFFLLSITKSNYTHFKLRQSSLNNTWRSPASLLHRKLLNEK